MSYLTAISMGQWGFAYLCAAGLIGFALRVR